MTRRVVGIVIALTVGFFSGPLTSDAQQPKKIPRVGVLAGPPASVGQPYVEAGRAALRDLGYVEGQNIAIDYRWGEAKAEVVRAQATELVNLKPDIIVTVAEGPTRAVKRLTSTIPIVMVAVDDPVGLGFVESLARPGGNVTGTASFLPELSAKRLQLLKEVVPRASRAVFLWNGNPGGVLGFKETEAAARTLGLTLQSFEAKAAADVAPAFSAMKAHRADALIVLTDPSTFSQRARVADLAAQHRLPAVYELREFVDAGGLMSYGASLIGMVRRTAVFVDKILKGAKPGDLPVEQPATFELVVNLKAAKALGLTIPQSVLIRADEVIQ
ncbi:MAG: ABC transporter substrate-binding protein [Candidatus Rokubacteria bacterium]|nr:ABC transporter substrate-binding protein [Candidatus Rokubacteria bacterium]